MESQSKAMRRRPELARYRPGMGKILGKKCDTNDSSIGAQKDSTIDTMDESEEKSNRHKTAKAKQLSSSHSNDINRSESKPKVITDQSFDNKSMNKKPDIEVYDPRKKISSNASSSYLSKNDSNRDKERVDSDKQIRQQYNSLESNERRNQKHKTGNKKLENKNSEHNFIENAKSSKTNVNLEYNRKENPKNIHNLKNKKTETVNVSQQTSAYKSKSSYNVEYDNHVKKMSDSNAGAKQNEIIQNTKNNSYNDNKEKVNKSGKQRNNSFNNNIDNENNRHESVRHRNYSTNKPQHRYEHQIPPRFLKKQQMLKQMENENTDEHQTNEDRLESQQLHSTQSESHGQRGGIIRLPAFSRNHPQDNYMNQNHSLDYNNMDSNASQARPEIRKSSNANKPCVVIRPTPHVSTENFPKYSHSMNRESNSLNSPTSSSNPFSHSGYSEYNPISSSLYSSSIPENEPRLQNISEMSSLRKKWKPNVDKSYGEAIAAENDLHLCLSQPSIDQQKVEQLRYRIQLRFEHIILSDLRVCAEYNIEQRLWKVAFYQFIEHYRRLMDHISDVSSQQDMKTAFSKIIDEATLFFENLLVKMQETYGFSIDKLVAHQYDRETENYDTLKLAAISAQKIYLYLGDLSRYKEVDIRNSNYAKSKSYYVRAQMLAPKNGRSYNQLALLAMYQNRRLDAVYYYMRSLAASNPFLTARENLLTIFDEVRRKYELADKKRKHDSGSNNNRNKETDSLKTDCERIEIWIRPDGSSAMCSNYTKFQEEESGKEELEMLSSVDLNKRFVLSFLHVHGKLFSKVGMDASEFIPVVNQMLLEFHCLLRRSPIPVSSQRLLQLLAINMFAVFHTSLKDTSYGNNCRSLLQEQAIQVTFAMMSLLLECGTSILLKHLQNNTEPNLNNDDLFEILPTIKIWTDWMSCQKHLWCPPPPLSEFTLSCDGDIWTIFAEFITQLTRINVRSVKLLPSKLEGCEPIILNEDTSLAGFLPLLGSPQCVQFAQPPYDVEKARTCLRITVIQFFGDYLCGITEPYLKFDVGRKKFVSLIPTATTSNSYETKEFGCNFRDENSENENEDYSADSSPIETASNFHTESNSGKSLEQTEIELLWSRKDALKKAKQRQEMIKRRVDAVLNEENQRNPSRIIIQPRYIVPDTNCFIDHLPMIKTLIHSRYYDLIVPLIVINELNGLKSRGIKTLKPLTFSDDHDGNVGKASMETINYLIDAFADKNLRLRSITSMGSMLDNINFISETISDTKGNSNDDLILNACLRFIKDKPLEKGIKETINHTESKSIFREVVLLTEDRNLRVKALSHNVPVKGLPVFLKWANIPLKH